MSAFESNTSCIPCGKLAWLKVEGFSGPIMVDCEKKGLHDVHMSSGGFEWVDAQDRTCGATHVLYSTGKVLTCTQDKDHGGEGLHGSHWDSAHLISWYDRGHHPKEKPRSIPSNVDPRAIENIGLSGLAPGFMAFVSGEQLPSPGRERPGGYYSDADTFYELALLEYMTGSWLEDWELYGGDEAHRRNIAAQQIAYEEAAL